MTENSGVGGRIMAGDVLLRIGSRHGAIAERVEAADRPAPKPRPAAPPSGPFPEVIDRIDAIERAVTALVAARAVLFHGPSGSGKTTLLRHLSRTATNDAPDGAGAWPDGTILLTARQTPSPDLLQVLFRALHASDTPVHATQLQLENGLRERQTLVLVDDLPGSAEQVREVLSTAPACAFALASETDPGELDVVRVPLPGLPPDGAVELVSKAIDREPSPLEAARIRELHRRLDGSPLLLLQVAAMIPAGDVDLETAAAATDDEDPVGALAGRLDEALPDPQRRALLALEAVRPATLSASDAAAIADLDDPLGTLEALAHRGLVRVDGSRYRGAGGLAAAVARRHDRAVWRSRAQEHFASLAAEPGVGPSSELERESLSWSLDQAIGSSRWASALALARAVEGDLALRSRWEAWGEVIERALEAARALDDAAAEAWALHQRGTRALALGETDRAIHDLERALDLREGIGEEDAAAATLANLSLLRGDEVVATPPVRGRKRAAGLPWALLAVALVILGAIGLLVLRGGGTEPVDAGSVRFESRPVGEEALAPVAVDNAATEAVEVGAVEIEGVDGEDFTIVGDECSRARLAPGTRCVVVLAFRPRDTGERAARLVVPFGGEPPREVSLSGRGLAASRAVVADGADGADPLSIAPGRLEFGEQPVGTRSGILPVAIVNRGSGPERVAVRLEPGGPGEFTLSGDACSNEVLPVGETCLVEVQFRPSRSGLRSAMLVVRKLGTGDVSEVALTGTGADGDGEAEVVEGTDVGTAPEPTATSGIRLASGEGAIGFGEVPVGSRSARRTVTIENRGADPVQVASSRLAGLDAAVFVIEEDRCRGRLLPAGATCTIDVAFEPSELGGWSARLVVRDPTGDGPEIDLEGTGR